MCHIFMSLSDIACAQFALDMQLLSFGLQCTTPMGVPIALNAVVLLLITINLDSNDCTVTSVSAKLSLNLLND